MTAHDSARTRPVWVSEPPQAPLTRLVDQFTGDLAERPSKFFEANDLATERNVELERLRRDNEMLRSQAEELAKAYESQRDELAEQHVRVQELWEQILERTCELQQVRAERNALAGQLAGLRAEATK